MISEEPNECTNHDAFAMCCDGRRISLADKYVNYRNNDKLNTYGLFKINWISLE